jgi:hypothetical protein
MAQSRSVLTCLVLIGLTTSVSAHNVHTPHQERDLGPGLASSIRGPSEIWSGLKAGMQEAYASIRAALPAPVEEGITLVDARLQGLHLTNILEVADTVRLNGATDIEEGLKRILCTEDVANAMRNGVSVTYEMQRRTGESIGAITISSCP